MHTVYLALGSNLGDRAGNIGRALRLLEQEGVRPVCIAAPITTAPEGFASGHLFLNTAGEFLTALAPAPLLLATQRVERSLGRTAKSSGGVYHDRTIDIDILFYDDLVASLPGLEIPHPRLSTRLFVLRPLCEIAPQLRHPVSGQTIAELCKAAAMQNEA